MAESRYQAKISQNVGIDHVEIKSSGDQPMIIPRSDIIKGRIKKSAHNYVDVCYCLFNDNKNVFHKLERIRTEVKVFVSTDKDKTAYELFSGLIYDDLQLEKIKELRVVKFIARSYPVILTGRILNHREIQYTRGFGEIIRKLVEPIRVFNTEGVKEETEEGIVYFDMISVLDAIRYLAYVKVWCLEFKSRSIFFGPCKNPKVPEFTLDLKDIERFSIKK